MGRQREMAVLVTLGLLVLSFETTLGQKYKPLTGTAGQAVIIQCGSSRDGCSWSKDGTRLSLDERSDQARFSVSLCDLSSLPGFLIQSALYVVLATSLLRLPLPTVLAGHLLYSAISFLHPI